MRFLLIFLAISCGFSFGQKVKIEDVYRTNCAGCHGSSFEGGQGGSLVDGIWKHGSSDEEIARTIAKGKPDLGMVSWEGVLSSEQIRGLVILLREKEKQTLAKGMKFPVPSSDEVVKTELHDYRVETLVKEGLTDPWAIAFLPDGRKLVTEKSGKLRFLSQSGELDPQAIEGLPEVIEHGQGGLMDVALHPDFQKNGWVYLGFADGTRPGDGESKGGVRCITAVVRGKIKDHSWGDQQWIYRPDPNFRSSKTEHFGMRILFSKGYVYFVIGERGGRMEAQDLSRPNGKIFRLYDDGRVPEDNPFVGNKEAIPGIWSYGHRNPQGLAMDVRDGSLYATEHGPRGGDELNLILPGRNYGWPVVTYGMNYDGTPIAETTEKEGVEKPLTYWVPSIATCGLDFYTGEKFPKWKNHLFVGALAQKEIRRVRLEGKKVISQEIILKNIGRVRDVATGPDGLIYVVLNNPDRVVRLVPAGN